MATEKQLRVLVSVEIQKAKDRLAALSNEVKKATGASVNLNTEIQKSEVGWKQTALGVLTGTAAYNLASRGVSMLTGFLGESINAAAQEQEEIAQLNAVLKSTAGVAGITADAAIQLWLFAIIEAKLTSCHTRPICAFAYCAHYVDRTPSAGSA